MSHSRSQKNESKSSRLPAQSGQPADVRAAAANRASIPVAETRYDPTHKEIAERAYQCWNERGCPDGTPEVDWSRAEQELRGKRQAKAANAT
ncbi:MAG TPA: DUF2934 domain-containing protein [Bryobacteraceae bacterium]